MRRREREMNAQGRSSAASVTEDALRRLVADPLTRERALEAIDRATGGDRDPEVLRMRTLAWLNRHELMPCLRRLVDEDYRFEDVRDDSSEAHRRAADIQRILRALGFELGPSGVDGYIGGPPGAPLALELEECAGLIERSSPREKLLSNRDEGVTESWTRDATRRLQFFLGSYGLPENRQDLRVNCLLAADGLFGSLTLAGLAAFLEHEPD
jgi:hypothetical protein